MQNQAEVVAVFGGSAVVAGTKAYTAGMECGRLLAERGYTVVTGGYAGTMEAVSAGAARSGGHVIGVTAPTVFRSRTGANPYVAEEIRATTIAERIQTLIDRSDAAIALPGSLGTVTELLVAWNVAYVARFGDTAPYPIAAVGSRWHAVIARLATELDTDESLIMCTDTVQAAVTGVAGALGSHDVLDS